MWGAAGQGESHASLGDAADNAVNTGLTRTWHDVPNSATTNRFTVPLDPANGSTFYRLVY